MSTLSSIALEVNGTPEQDILVFDQQTALGHETDFPMSLDCMVIALCTQGSGRIGIDLNEYEIKKNTLFVIQPRNYIFLTDYSPDIAVQMVAISQRVVRDVLPKMTDVLPLLLHHRSNPVIGLDDGEAREMGMFYSFLKQILKGEPTKYSRQKVLCILQAALYEMMDIRRRSAGNTSMPRTRRQEIMAKFLLLVSQNFRTERQLSYYAGELCITPKHLSAVVKEISGRTAGDWIENYVVMEAQVLLKTTDLSIQEISNRLNFANQSFFGKYFKHLTGISPSQYRKANA